MFMSDKSESDYTNGRTAFFDLRPGAIEDTRRHLAMGDRDQAAYYLARIEYSALHRRRKEIEGASHLRKLQDFGVDLSLLGRHGDIGRQSPEQINSQLIAVDEEIHRAEQSQLY